MSCCGVFFLAGNFWRENLRSPPHCETCTCTFPVLTLPSLLTTILTATWLAPFSHPAQPLPPSRASTPAPEVMARLLSCTNPSYSMFSVPSFTPADALPTPTATSVGNGPTATPSAATLVLAQLTLLMRTVADMWTSAPPAVVFLASFALLVLLASLLVAMTRRHHRHHRTSLNDDERNYTTAKKIPSHHNTVGAIIEGQKKSAHCSTHAIPSRSTRIHEHTPNRCV